MMVTASFMEPLGDTPLLAKPCFDGMCLKRRPARRHCMTNNPGALKAADELLPSRSTALWPLSFWNSQWNRHGCHFLEIEKAAGHMDFAPPEHGPYEVQRE